MIFTRRAVLGGLLAAPMIGKARAMEPVSYLFPAPSFLPAFVPHRDNPIARQSLPRANEIRAHLFDALHLDERVEA